MRPALKAFIVVLTLTFMAPPLFAAQRIFYEDCEGTNYSQHFLEDYWGTGYESWWNEFNTEISQSKAAHGGSYSMVYNPFLTGNPRGSIGTGPIDYGNLSDFNLSNYTNRYWYFRWYQKWEDSTYSGLNKVWYLGGGGDYYYLAKTGPSTFIVRVSNEYGGDMIVGEWVSHSSSLDDEQWHKMEIYLDVGTAGDSNGETWFRIDDQEVYRYTNLSFTSQNRPTQGPLACPANASGDISGSQRVWLDDLEIYTLSGPNDTVQNSAPSPIPPPTELAVSNN